MRAVMVAGNSHAKRGVVLLKRSARIATCGNLVTIFGVLAFLLACLFAHIAPSRAAKDPTRPVDPQTTSGIQATNGQIYFNSDREGNAQIYSINHDGSGQIRLTNDSAIDADPSWSNTSKKIVFASNRDGRFQIYMINADGSVQTRLSNNTFDDEFPDWSPDGTKIAFASMHDGDQEIYVMNANGSNQTRLTNMPGSDGLPVWSPDGTKIAF